MSNDNERHLNIQINSNPNIGFTFVKATKASSNYMPCPNHFIKILHIKSGTFSNMCPIGSGPNFNPNKQIK